MLMEMWVVLKSLSQSNCHNVTMTFINSYNDRIECSKVDVVIPVSALVMTPQSMMRLPSRRCCSFRVLSKLCPSMSLFLSLSPPPVPLVPFTTFTQSQTRTHTHTQIHGVLHDGWLHALYLQNQGWKVQRFIRGVCLSADKFVCILLSAGQVTRKMVTHLVIKYPREKKLHDEQNSFNTLL